MGLNDTAKEVNIKSSLRRFFIEELYQTGSIPVVFGQGFAYPSGLNSDVWVNVEFNEIYWGHNSKTFPDLFVCTNKGYDDHYLDEKTDVIRGMMSEADDEDSTDGWKRITLYKYAATQPWDVIGHAQIIEVLTPTGVITVDGVEGYKFSKLVPEIVWAAGV